MANTVLTALKRATKDLLYLSESDEPFETFVWPDAAGPLTTAKVRQLAGKGARTPVEEVSLDDFFHDLLEEHDHTPEEKADIERYQNLLKVLKKHLADLKVFRVGRVRVDIYLVGKTAAGEWAGIKTVAVET